MMGKGHRVQTNPKTEGLVGMYQHSVFTVNIAFRDKPRSSSHITCSPLNSLWMIPSRSLTYPLFLKKMKSVRKVVELGKMTSSNQFLHNFGCKGSQVFISVPGKSCFQVPRHSRASEEELVFGFAKVCVVRSTESFKEVLFETLSSKQTRYFLTSSLVESSPISEGPSLKCHVNKQTLISHFTCQSESFFQSKWAVLG